jgi:transmembrane sensor
MKSPHSHHDSVADEQAALWAARLDGDVLDGNMRAELDEWLAQKSTHRALLSQYCEFGADLEEQIP